MAINSERPSIAAIRKSEGDLPTIAFLIDVIGENIKFFNVGKHMNDAQLVETAKLIAQEFYFLKPDDLVIFFNRLKSGFYGELFDRLDGQIIMLKLREYCEERTSTAESLTIEAHKKFLDEEKKEAFYVTVDNEYVREEAKNQLTLVTKKEMATSFPYDIAYAIRKYLQSRAIDGVVIKIVNVNKPGESIIDYLKKHRPDLVPAESAYVSATEKYIRAKEQIMSAEYEDELDRVNDLRKIAGLEPLTRQEFDLHNEIHGTKQKS